MSQPTSLLAVADPYDVIVFDQWGVLHNGRTPYPGAVRAMEQLAHGGKQLAVLSNSGKRAYLNAKRIASLGLPMDLVANTMTSGEAFWLDCRDGDVSGRRFFAITGRDGDALDWSDGLTVTISTTLENADAVLLMGLPEGSDGKREEGVLEEALERSLTVVCTNPDRGSPREGGRVQVSPGALAHAYRDRGGTVVFYGKPHRPIYERLLADLGVRAAQCLMVGDSIEHDVAGAQGVGMDSAFVTTGLYASDFSATDDAVSLAGVLAADQGLLAPTFVLDRLSEVWN